MKSVKEVRVKIRTYDQWVGSFNRKSMPLCEEHHNMLHAGKLTKEEVKKLQQV